MKRSAESTPPLGLKNTVNKAIAAAINYAIAYAISKWADTQRNGFVCGWQSLNNIIDIDARARISDMNATAMLKTNHHQKQLKRPPSGHKEISQLLAVILFDFCAAFPSMAHQLIFMSCEGMRLPDGLIKYIKSLYTNNKYLYRGDEKTKIVVDPFLRLLKNPLPDSTNRAFADDIATIIKKLDDLKSLKANFDRFRDISGLELKIKKCCRIPLGHDPSTEWMTKKSKAITQIVPNWANFTVAPSVEYLGIIIGPKGSSGKNHLPNI